MEAFNAFCAFGAKLSVVVHTPVFVSIRLLAALWNRNDFLVLHLVIFLFGCMYLLKVKDDYYIFISCYIVSGIAMGFYSYFSFEFQHMHFFVYLIYFIGFLIEFSFKRV